MKKLSTLFRWLVISSISAVCVMGGVLRAGEPDLKIYRKAASLTDLGLTNVSDYADVLMVTSDNYAIGIQGENLRERVQVIPVSTATNTNETYLSNRVAQSSTDPLPYFFRITKVSESEYTLRDSVNHKYLAIDEDKHLVLSDAECKWQMSGGTTNGYIAFYVDFSGTQYYIFQSGSQFKANTSSTPFYLYKKQVGTENAGLYFEKPKGSSIYYLKGRDVKDSMWVVGGCLAGDITIGKADNSLTDVTVSPESVTKAQAAAGFYLTFTYKNCGGESYHVVCKLESTGADATATFNGTAYGEVSSLKELLTKPTEKDYHISGGVVVTTYAQVGTSNNAEDFVWLQDTAQDGAAIEFYPSARTDYKRGDLLCDFVATFYPHDRIMNGNFISQTSYLRGSVITPQKKGHALHCDTVTIAQLNANHTLANPYLNKLVPLVSH